jgi:hypothetical protein
VYQFNYADTLEMLFLHLKIAGQVQTSHMGICVKGIKWLTALQEAEDKDQLVASPHKMAGPSNLPHALEFSLIARVHKIESPCTRNERSELQ